MKMPAIAASVYLGLQATLFVATADSADLDQALSQLKTFTHAQDRTPLFAIEAAIDQSVSDADARTRIRSQLMAILEQPTAPTAAKQFACRMLERIGTKAHAPVLAKLLGVTETADCARRALEKIPGAAASDALLGAMQKSEGKVLVGVINSLAARRETRAVAAIAARLADADPKVAVAAVSALGRIATTEAASALTAVRSDVAPPVRRAIPAALLRCADHLVASGQGDAADGIYEKMRAQDATHLRTAALAGLANTRKERALPLLLDALGSRDGQMRGTAAFLLAKLRSPTVAAALAGRLPELDGQACVVTMQLLADIGGPAARKAVADLAESKDGQTRVAALRALAKLGDASTVETLARAASRGDEAERAAARDSLARLAGPGVDAAILAGAGKGDWRTRVELLDAVVARRVPKAMSTLMTAARDGHHLVRLAGFKGLRGMAGAEHYPALVKLLVDAPTVRDIRAAQKAMTAAAKKIEAPDARVQPVLSAFKSVRPEAKVAMLEALAVYGGPQSFQTIVRATREPEPTVQNAAVRALAGWKDDSASPELLKLLKETSNETHRALALRGCLRLARAKAADSPDESLRRLEQVRDAASTPSAKTMLLSALGALNTPGALPVAAAFIGDSEVGREARMTTFALARSLRASHPDAVTRALQSVLEKRADPEALRQANILLGNTSFVPLFDGKSLAGWIKPFDWGQVEIKDGAIHLQGDRKFFLVTEKTYGDFVLELEAWLDHGANSGIQYRSHYKRNFLWGYQADVDSLPRGWRGIYDETPGRRWINRGDAEKAETLYKPEWNQYRVECIGDRTRFFMNGELIVDHLDPMEIDGHIALQHHGEKGRVVRFRNIRIMDLGKRRWLPLVDESTISKWESNGVGKWIVEDGVINGRKTGGGHGLLYSPMAYGDFCLRFKVKAVQGNAGFYIRSEKGAGTQGARGLQAEIDPKKDQSGLYETHGRKWVGKPDQGVVKKQYKRGDWNEIAVCARGRRILVYLNGHRTVELTNDSGRLEGYLGLGLHGGTVHTQFKDVVILSD